MDEQRAILADTLYDFVCALRASADFDEWGDIALHTFHAGVLTDGWSRVENPKSQRFMDPTLTEQQIDVCTMLPNMMYIMELTLANGAKAVLAILATSKMGTNYDAISIGMLPLHGVQWRNADYVPNVCLYTSVRNPTAEHIADATPSIALIARDLFKVSLLQSYFTCVRVVNPQVFVFSSRASRVTITLQVRYLGQACVVKTAWPWWCFRSPQRAVFHCLCDLVGWAESHA